MGSRQATTGPPWGGPGACPQHRVTGSWVRSGAETRLDPNQASPRGEGHRRASAPCTGAPGDAGGRRGTRGFGSTARRARVAVKRAATPLLEGGPAFGLRDTRPRRAHGGSCPHTAAPSRGPHGTPRWAPMSARSPGEERGRVRSGPQRGARWPGTREGCEGAGGCGPGAAARRVTAGRAARRRGYRAPLCSAPSRSDLAAVMQKMDKAQPRPHVYVNNTGACSAFHRETAGHQGRGPDGARPARPRGAEAAA